uniref:LRR receptor-like serine/threonine-protein kinase FLS2 n=1 Tax=Cajanus cajan TaxID=3821 RepID=A0A151RVT6_CAJCA|nr:LRR receptor-like serine/threonine-protein kinase FLS2 [Cajanus cajan]
MGQIPIEISSLTRLENLSIIRLDENNLSSPVSETFANFPNLTTLHLSSCRLTGKFPKKILQLATLSDIDLSFNYDLYGSLPEFPPNGPFQTLIVSHTRFSGVLPASINNLGQLSTLDLSNSHFNGTLPSSMSRLGELTYLLLSFNNFTGPIPSLNMSRNLIHLDLSHNDFTGSITSVHLEGLRELVLVDLQDNLLNGSLPSSLFSLPLLRSIQLSNNSLSGSIPQFLCNHSSLLVLDVSYNLFNGTIPECLTQSETLVVLNLQHNKFHGSIPDKFPVSCALKTLDFNNNLLKGLQLEFVKVLSLITSVDFSSNNFHGTIPEELMNFKRIIFLNLSHNALEGQIPSSIGNLKQIESLDLSSNNLDGEIPTQLENLNFLSYLNLSFNHLEGKIPVGTQLQSFDASSFAGNVELCGPPLIKNCSGEIHGLPMSPHGIGWNILRAELGFVLGLGLVIGPLLFWKQWRQHYWQRVDFILCCIFPQLSLEYETRGGHGYQVLRWRY